MSRPPGVYLDAVSRMTRTRVGVVKVDDEFQIICEHLVQPTMSPPPDLKLALYAARNSYMWCAACAEHGGFDPPDLVLDERAPAVLHVHNERTWIVDGDGREIHVTSHAHLADVVRDARLTVTRCTCK